MISNLTAAQQRQSGEVFSNCNHGRAFQFLLESVSATSCQFEARSCANWEQFQRGACDQNEVEIMGYDATPPPSPDTRMTLYFRTAAHSPFCLGKDGLKPGNGKDKMELSFLGRVFGFFSKLGE